MYKILAINPGSTSTKFAIYHDETPVIVETVRHDAESLKPFNCIVDQFEFRKQVIVQRLAELNVDIKELDAIVGRGGLIRSVSSGVYEVDDAMRSDLHNCLQGEHACNLGGLIADDMLKETTHARAFIADPVVVDELSDVARVGGHPLFPRKSLFHALNQKAIARLHASKMDKNYEDINLVVAHLGGGISVGAHEKGRVVDVNNALTGYGPFTPERTGTVATGEMVKLCFSGEYSCDEIMKMLVGQGGLMAHLGTNEAHVATARAEAGDEQAILVLDAMVYQIAKEIGSMCTALKGDVDGIILTGGIAYNNYIVDRLKPYIEYLSTVYVYPGEDELWALAFNGLQVLKGMTPKVY